jgi:hypothetical protein
MQMANDWAEGMKRARRFEFLEEGPFVGPNQPEPDGQVATGWDQNRLMPAYRVGEELVPFTPLAQIPPDGYEGDWRVEAFSDAAIKERWRMADDREKARIREKASFITLPHEFRATGQIDARGRIDPHGEVDLRAIRRPAYFGEAPWNEGIAEADSHTSIVEFEVPREPFEVLQMGLKNPIRLRGWHIAGDGVPDGNGGRTRALVMLSGGRSIETTATHHPDYSASVWSEEAGGWVQTSYPDEERRAEGFGGRPWRTYLLAFARAGFDVLTLDKRGHGISGGANDANANEHGEDIFRVLDAMETGNGVRILNPAGKLLQGRETAGLLLSGRSARTLPVFLAGASQGCMVVCWAMHKNFVGPCDFERPEPKARVPYGYNIKGALLIAPFGGGLGYRAPDDALVEAFRRVETHVQLMPTGEVLAGVSKWPAIFIGRGLWDFSESLEGSLECFRRAAGRRMIVTVRGPHGEGEWGEKNIAYMQDCMTSFATAVLSGKQFEDYVEPRTLRELVAMAPPYWPSTARPLT